MVIIKKFRSQLASEHTGGKTERQSPKLRGNILEIFKNRYFSFIFFLSVFSMVGLIFVDYTFLGVTKAAYPDKIQLTKFFGFFFGVIKAVELVAKAFLAGRLLDRFGLKFGLAALPFILLIFTSLAVLIGFAFPGQTSLFFIVLAMNMLFLIVVKKSIEDTSFKMLYQPLDTQTKLILQTQTEGKARQMATVTAGVVLTLLGLIASFSLLHAVVLLFLILIGWITIATRTYTAYQSTLKEQLSGSGDVIAGQEQKGTYGLESLRKGLKETDEEKRLKSFTLMARIDPIGLVNQYSLCLEDPSPAIRRATLRQLEKYPVLSADPMIRGKAPHETDPVLKQDMEKLKTTFVKIRSMPKEAISELFSSKAMEDRVIAAMSMSHLPEADHLPLLNKLLHDQQKEVIEATSIAIAKRTDDRFLKLLTDELLYNTSHEHTGLKLLLDRQEVIAPLIRSVLAHYDTKTCFQWWGRLFKMYEHKPLTLIMIIRAMGTIEHNTIHQFLEENLNYNNHEIRHELLTALRYSGFQATTKKAYLFYKQLILQETATCTWLIAAIHDLEGHNTCSELVALLTGQYEEVKDNLFSLLSFIHDPAAILRIKNNLESRVREREVLAIEMADVLLDEELKEWVFPIIDQVPFHEKLKKLRNHFLQQSMGVEERLKAIIYYDYSKLDTTIKALAIERLTVLSDKLPFEIAAHLYGREPFLKEMAYIALYRLHPEGYPGQVIMEPERERSHFDQVTGANPDTGKKLSILEKIRSLKQVRILEEMPPKVLTKMALLAEELATEDRRNIGLKREGKEYVFVVLQGVLQVSCPDQPSHTFEAEGIAGVMEPVRPAECTLRPTPDARVLYLDASVFFSLSQVYPELAKLRNIWVT